jgi:branched-chain amino acid aminotransferase
MPEVDDSFLRRQLSALLGVYRPGEARVRAVMTKQGQVYLSMEPLKPLPRHVYEKGVRVETTDLYRRQPRLKSTSFIDRSDAERKHIAQEGIFEALLVKDEKILEGMTSNFFYIRAERNEVQSKHRSIVYTAEQDVLFGVTRETVLDIARGRGLQVKYQPLQRNQMDMIDEAFLTSSSRGIVPVIQMDHVTIGQGKPGPITKQLSAAYQKYVIEKAETIL